MSESGINIFDSVVLAIMGLSCLIAFFRGLVREVMSLVAWIGAGIVTVAYYGDVMEEMRTYFKSDVVAVGASVIGLYIVALIGFSLLNMFILKTIKRSGESGMLDNMLGLIFGAVRGAFIISLGFFLITTVVSEDNYPEWLEASVSRPYAEKGADLLKRLAPDSLEEITTLQKKAAEEAKERMETGLEEGAELYDRQRTQDFNDESNDDVEYME